MPRTLRYEITVSGDGQNDSYMHRHGVSGTGGLHALYICAASLIAEFDCNCCFGKLNEMQGKLASDLTGDEDIRRILDLKLSKSYIYKDRFSVMVT